MDTVRKKNGRPVIKHGSRLYNQMVEWRRDIHMHPELAYDERRTARLIAKVLKDVGMDPVEGVGRTGVVATLRGRLGDGDAIGLRADMDALPIAELNEFPHRSTHDSKMHACGHDGHTAMLLGAAVALAEHRGFFGKVHFIFQPAEEGAAGAKAMIEDELFQRFPTEQVYSLHNWPRLKCGEAAIHEGPVMASYNTFSVKINGKGCHAAMPHQGVDPISAVGQMITAIYGIIGRNVDPLESGVISITRIDAGGTYNVIPDSAELRGSVRTFSESVRVMIKQRIEDIVSGVGASMNCKTEFEYCDTYPATINTREEARVCKRVLDNMPDIHRAFTDLSPSMASEDFSYMLANRRGCYIWLGSGIDENTHGLHSPFYDFNDDVLSIGANYWIGLTYELLSS